MSDSAKKTREEKEAPERWSFIPYFVERMFGTVESFVERIAGIVRDQAQEAVNRTMQKLFGLLLLVVGITFFLAGGAEVINQVVRFPGVGQMVVGTVLLLVTGVVMSLMRPR